MILCPVSNALEYDVVNFLQDAAELMIYLVPPAIALVLWKVFVTTPRARVAVLGLVDSSASYAKSSGRRISAWVLYLFTSILTFSLGAFVFDVYRYLTGLISSLAAWKFHW
jgi:hypothetical protein